MNVTFEAGRLYVAPRKSVLFFAKVGDQWMRCYVPQEVLIGPPRTLREEADLCKRCLVSFDEHVEAIRAAAARLIEASLLTADGAVIVSQAALTLQVPTSRIEPI